MTKAASERQRVRLLIQRAPVAILTTLDQQGAPVGRPMLPLLLDREPDIFFLTHQHSRKVAQIAARPRIGVALSSEGRHFVIAGSAFAARDLDLIGRLWKPGYRAWFPDGADDREATVLRVVVDRVDYWEPPQSRASRVFEALTAWLTGRAAETPMKTITGL